MRIAQLVSNLHPTAAESTKGIYTHVGFLADYFVELGHETHLFASGNSKTKAILHSITEGSLDQMGIPEDIQKHYMLGIASACYKEAANFDIIHSHFSLLSAFFSNLVTTPTLTSMHTPIRDGIRPLLKRYKDLSYISFSYAQRKQMPELNWCANVYHGVDTELFKFNPTPGEYFLYLGRVTEDKGAHLAIEAAKAAKVPLLIAGRSAVNEGYWQSKVEPEIDGKMVRYVGEANQAQKIALLQGAKGLLFPTQVDETFGLVMIEAMACGTPIIAWNNGSVPEVVSDKRTGYIVDNVEGMVKAIQSIQRISREATRHRAEVYFSQQKMSQGYLRVYERVIEESKKRAL